jgi:hypothetical protein
MNYRPCVALQMNRKLRKVYAEIVHSKMAILSKRRADKWFDVMATHREGVEVFIMAAPIRDGE